MGNIYYWDIMDSEIEVYIRADTGEIIFYDNLGYVDGSKTEQEINESADLIVKQFSELPTDSGSPENVYLDDLLGFIECDPVTGNETDTYYSYWQVIYSRYHSNVMTDDFIKILLLPNGDCSLYKKIWNMDLSGIEDKPHHTSREAQEKAIDYVLANGGVDVTVNETELIIVRPTYEGYRDTVLYGKDPVLAWYVTLYDEQGNIWYVTVKDSDRSIIEVDYIL
jgi:hypothetical protein